MLVFTWLLTKCNKKVIYQLVVLLYVLINVLITQVAYHAREKLPKVL